MTTETTEDKRLSTVLGALLKKNGITANALANALNLYAPTINRIAAGDVLDPRASTLMLIANYFGITIDQLLGLSPLPSLIKQGAGPVKSRFAIPILDLQQATDYQKYINSAEDYIYWYGKDEGISDNLFSIQLKNTVYSPIFNQGTFLMVDPQVQPTTGHYILVKFHNDPLATIKKYLSEGRHKYLAPLNPDFKTIPFNENECSIIGLITRAHVDFLTTS